MSHKFKVALCDNLGNKEAVRKAFEDCAQALRDAGFSVEPIEYLEEDSTLSFDVWHSVSYEDWTRSEAEAALAEFVEVFKKLKLVIRKQEKHSVAIAIPELEMEEFIVEFDVWKGNRYLIAFKDNEQGIISYFHKIDRPTDQKMTSEIFEQRLLEMIQYLRQN